MTLTFQEALERIRRYGYQVRCLENGQIKIEGQIPMSRPEAIVWAIRLAP